MKKIIIAGGSGFLGKALTSFFVVNNFEVIILSRSSGLQKNEQINFIQWDGKTVEPNWQQALEGAEAVINLSGKSINCRFNATNKKELLTSRIDSTKAIGNAIAACQQPPKVWFNSSSTAIYSNDATTANNEFSTTASTNFLTELTYQWEAAMQQFALQKTRKMMMRTSLIMAKNDGVFLRLKTLTKFLAGGKQGNGKQMVSWLHVDDFCAIVLHLMNNETANGVYNFCAPQPISNAALMKTIQQKINSPIALPAPAWLLKIGALFIGTEPDLILNSTNVISEKLRLEKFAFKYSTFSEAIIELIGR